jgi:hypothetical protein
MSWHPNSNKHKATHCGYKSKPTQGQVTMLLSMYSGVAPLPKKKLQKKFGNSLAIRLNGTSDIPFENIKIKSPLKDSYYTNIFEAFPTVRFYDYTKNPKRMFLNIPNYSLTFSRAESSLNIENSKTILNANKNVAIVFNNKLYTEIIKVGKIRYNNKLINVIDGDETDLRFLDKQNSIIALKAKGKAIKDTSGFVVHSLDEL